jgi:glycosyltransferase involved in cell wall biosynthesis
MKPPAVSVIIPTYGGADFLGEAIQSVLNQTFKDFELIVVNDASPDHTDEVVRRFDDPRLRYIRHEQNRGVANARKTGVMQSQGDIIAHLDQDDLFHPEKLSTHVDYLEKHPEVGFTYNSRFELSPSSGAIREILRPSPNLSLANFVLGFPLAPSVWVHRREWGMLGEIWEEKTFYRGREIVICGRLYMAGCKFAMIDRVLNYRRYHKNRVIKNVARQCEAERTCQQIIFDDPRCPADVRALKDIASSNIYAMWAYVAYLQGEVDLGKDMLGKAVQLNPALLHGTPPALVNYLIVDSIDDGSPGHEIVLETMFENLPKECAELKNHHRWAVTRGYLLQGVRAVMWNRPATAQECFSRAKVPGGQLDESFLQWTTSHLLSYETEFGEGSASQVLQQLCLQLMKLGIPDADRKLKSYYYANRAFMNYDQGRYHQVQVSVMQAILNSPASLKNKGLLSVFLHSLRFLRGG